MQAYYFGAWSENKVGHYLYAPGGSTCHGGDKTLPFRPSILDTGLLPQDGTQVEGVCHRSVINGWTVVAFWDRSADSRPGSNSAFVLKGEQSIDCVVAVVRKLFPEVFGRPGFPTLSQSGS